MVQVDAQTLDLATIWSGEEGASVVARRPSGQRWRHHTSRRKRSANVTEEAINNYFANLNGHKPTIASHGPWRINQSGGGLLEW